MEETEVKEEVTTVQESHPQQVVTTTKQVTPAVRTEHPQKVFEKKKTIFRFNQVIWYILVFIEVLIVFRFVFKMIQANAYSGFVSLIYNMTSLLVLPFQGIVPSAVTGASVIEWASIFAAIVYFLIASGLVYILQLVKPVTPREVEEHVG